jgi:hypothetical protein
MRDNPRFEDSFEFAVSLVGGEEGVVLVAARDINVNLTIGASDGVLVNVRILPVKVTLGRGGERWVEGKVEEVSL